MTDHACGLEVTCCSTCQAELEEGQTGLCDDCAPDEEYKFSELSEPAKDKARDALRYSEYYLHDEWWDGVYEGAGRVATILGLDIMETQRSSKNSWQAPAINFSGFCNQGDGACFRGSYSFNPKAIDEIKAYCNDKVLIRIAEQLTVLQLARRLLSAPQFTASITTSGRYNHSGAMDVEVNSEDEDDIHSEVSEALEDEVTQLMRSFADWIYRALEAEHDYLMSDEVVDERLEEETFDEFGSVI